MTQPFPFSLGLQRPVDFPVYCTPEAGLDLAVLELVPERIVRCHFQPQAPRSRAVGPAGAGPTPRVQATPSPPWRPLPASPASQPRLAVPPAGSRRTTAEEGPCRGLRAPASSSSSCGQGPPAEPQQATYLCGCGSWRPKPSAQSKVQGVPQGVFSKRPPGLNVNQGSQSLGSNPDKHIFEGQFRLGGG